MKNIILCNAFSLGMLDPERKETSLKIREVSERRAKKILGGGFTSCVGHEDTAEVLSGIFRLFIPENRVSVSLTQDSVLLVAQLLGGRLPEGSTTLPEGFSFRFLTVEMADS